MQAFVAASGLRGFFCSPRASGVEHQKSRVCLNKVQSLEARYWREGGGGRSGAEDGRGDVCIRSTSGRSWHGLSANSPSLRFRRQASSQEGEVVQELLVSSEAANIPDEDATAAEAVAEDSPDTVPTTKVKFQLQRECHFGEQYNVVGGDPQFGDWDPDAAIPLAWSKDHVWTGEIDVPCGKTIEFKYILKGKEGEVKWQPGANLVLETDMESTTLSITQPWDSSLTEDRSPDEVEEGEASTTTGQKEEKEEVSSPGDAFPDVIVSGTLSALNAGLKTVTALDERIGAILPLDEHNGEEEHENNTVAEDNTRSIDKAPTAHEIPVISATLSAAAEEVRGDNKETEDSAPAKL